jgi:hypothetical protein
MKHIESIQNAIKAMHGCDSQHVESVQVHEVFQGQTAWQGTVEVFDLIGHGTAKRAYAWQYQDSPEEIKTVAVLEIPPVDSPQNAVKVAIARHGRKITTEPNKIPKPRKKSVWRLIGGVILLAGVSNSLRNHTNSPNTQVFIWYLFFNFLLVVIGVWLAVSYLRQSK